MDDRRRRTTHPPLPPMARDDDGEHAPIWSQIHLHDGRLSRLEHDFRDTRQALDDMSVSLRVAVRTMEDQEERFGIKLSEQFLRHEARESTMQMRVMIYGVGLLITALGALAWYVLSHVRLGA